MKRLAVLGIASMLMLAACAGNSLPLGTTVPGASSIIAESPSSTSAAHASASTAGLSSAESSLATSAASASGVPAYASAAVAPAASGEIIQPYLPGTYEPPIANAGAPRVLTARETAEAAQAAAILGDPNRIVFQHTGSGTRRARNVLAGGNGEAVGMWTNGTFAQGSVTNMGVVPNYIIGNGDLFFHTHIFVANSCFEYGINYSYATAYLFGYNWCTGGNTPQGFMVKGLVGPAGGALNSWNSTGNGGLIAWDATMGIDKISLEEVQKADGWHLLGYSWTKKVFVDLMNGFGVTGTRTGCCGWDLFEEHGTPGTSCDFDPAFPKGGHLLYDEKKQVLVKGVWHYLESLPGSELSYGTMIDCADIASSTAGYSSPYFSGAFFAAPATSAFGAQHTGDWWLTQR